MFDTIKPVIVLCIVSALAGSAISIAHSRAQKRTEAGRAGIKQTALQSFFPKGVVLAREYDADNPRLGYWTARKDDTIAGYVFEGNVSGYCGKIDFMAAADTQGVIINLKIISEDETPGLGARIGEAAHINGAGRGFFASKGPADAWFTEQFRGLSLSNPIGISFDKEWGRIPDREKEALRAENTVTAITGATITTVSICNGLRKYAALQFNKIKNEAQKRTAQALDSPAQSPADSADNRESMKMHTTTPEALEHGKTAPANTVTPEKSEIHKSKKKKARDRSEARGVEINRYACLPSPAQPLFMCAVLPKNTVPTRVFHV